MIPHSHLNYFISYTATENGGIFNKSSLVNIQAVCTGRKVNTVSHLKWNARTDTMSMFRCLDHQELFIAFMRQRADCGRPFVSLCDIVCTLKHWTVIWRWWNNVVSTLLPLRVLTHTHTRVHTCVRVLCCVLHAALIRGFPWWLMSHVPFGWSGDDISEWPWRYPPATRQGRGRHYNVLKIWHQRKYFVATELSIPGQIPTLRFGTSTSQTVGQLFDFCGGIKNV